MRVFGKWLGRVLLALVLAVGALWAFGPYEKADLAASFDADAFGGDLDAYFAASEARVPGITPGTEKRVVWAGAPGVRTDLALVYIHGFSATSEEIRPVPDRVAADLGANLVFTRLAGHGLPGDALAEATVADWMADTAEAIAAGRAAGHRVVLVTTSTGGTLAAAAAQDAALMRDVAGIVFVSPNFGLNTPFAPLLTWPAARHWLPLIAGDTRAWEVRNDVQARFWTTEYPSVAVVPMAALTRAVSRLDHGRATVPALFLFSPDDRVVRADLTEDVAAAWGGPVTILRVTPGPEDDPTAHVIAGDIFSPGLTDEVTAAILGWARDLR
jgi:alpha-beta hydrolase superfamily lysophospholipase